MSETRHAFLERGVVSSLDRPAWLAARPTRLGGSDAARWSKLESWPLYLRAKMTESFTGNDYTRHGHEREPVILRQFGWAQNHMMFRSIDEEQFTATPDGIMLRRDGTMSLAQVKTKNKPVTGPNPSELRQMAWEQFVMDAYGPTLFAWEDHSGFRPTRAEPQSVWVPRNEALIDHLKAVGGLILGGMREASAERNR